MPDNTNFVVNDRRKFTADGELRHEAPTVDATSKPTQDVNASDSSSQLHPQSTASNVVPLSTSELADLPEAGGISELYPDHTAALMDEEEEYLAHGSDLGGETVEDDSAIPPGPTADQSSEAARAYAATVDRLDTAMRAANPGGDRMPEMTFERLVQSLYTQALLLLGGAAEPGETPRVDILGARQTIDMLAVMSTKVSGNLTTSEQKLLDSALFDLHMGFLEITQALARQAAQRQAGAGSPGASPLGGTAQFGGSGPRILR